MEGWARPKPEVLIILLFPSPEKSKLKVQAGKKQIQSLSQVGKNQFISGLQSKVKELWPNG